MQITNKISYICKRLATKQTTKTIKVMKLLKFTIGGLSIKDYLIFVSIAFVLGIIVIYASSLIALGLNKMVYFLNH